MITPIELLINLFNASFMAYTYHFFFNYFAPKRLNTFFHVSLLSLISIFLTCILSFVPMGFIRTILFCLVPVLTAFLYKMKWYNNVLLAFLIYALTCISEFVITVLIATIFSVSTQVAVSGVFMILGIILSKMVLIIIIVILRIFKYRISYSLTPKRILTLLIIPLSTVVLSLVHINWIVKFPIESQPLSSSNTISYVILIISNLTIFHLIDNSYKETEREKQLTTVTELLQAQSQQYKQMQEHNNAIMKMRHDHKNFILGLISELENNRTNTAKNALKEQLSFLEKPGEMAFNNIVSAVVKTKADIAKPIGISIDFQYSELHKIQISATDIAIILGNAMDNAIEAIQKNACADKTIHTIVKVNQDLIVMIVKNSVTQDIDTNNLISTKRSDGSMGFGIASIKELAKKYDGDVIFQCKNLIFETNIVMRNTYE